MQKHQNLFYKPYNKFYVEFEAYILNKCYNNLCKIIKIYSTHTWNKVIILKYTTWASPQRKDRSNGEYLVCFKGPLAYQLEDILHNFLFMC